MTYVRATVSDDEKADVKRVQDELDLNESELIRSGLKKMGVKIAEKKPRGTLERKVTPEIEAAVRADHLAGITWNELIKKYQLAKGTIAKIVEDNVTRIDDEKIASIRADYLALGYSKTMRKYGVSNTTMTKICGDLIAAKKNNVL